MPYREVIEQRLRFLEIDQTTVGSLQSLKRLLETEVDHLLDEFYAHIAQEPELRSVFADEVAMARARNAQKRYWLDYLFAKTFGRAHFEQAEHIAQAHLRAGLPLSGYMGGYCYMLNQIAQLACLGQDTDKETLSEEIQALNKLVFLDMTTVTDRYLEAKNETMRELLRRATLFAEDMTTLSKELANAQQDLQAKLDAAGASAEIAASAAQLSSQVRDVATRLEKFRFDDRLYMAHHRSEKGFLARIRRFIAKHS